jgi:hypothetical protein
LTKTNSGTWPDSTGHKQDTRFQPGQSGNPAGRPKGARNKLSEGFLNALADDFDTHGRDVIAKVRESRPHEYLRVIVATLPKRLETEPPDRPLELLSDEELTRIIRDAEHAQAKPELLPDTRMPSTHSCPSLRL